MNDCLSRWWFKYGRENALTENQKRGQDAHEEIEKYLQKGSK